MFIKKLDYLSPPVTFYHYGALSHSSILSGIISIITIIVIIIFIVYFSLDLIYRRDPKAFYYNSFVQDADTIYLNSSALFHFISLATMNTYYLSDGFDFTYFRIVGFDTYYEAYLRDKNLSKYDHWLYGHCNNESDTNGINYLIDFDFYEKSACIRKYFNSSEQKYYDTEDSNFRWPSISHGTYHPNYTIYNFVIERCQEDTVNLILGEGQHCKTISEIDELILNNVVCYFYFINYYSDLLNYNNPNKKYIFSLQHVFKPNLYTANHLNFNPSIIKTHNGLFFDNIKEERAYVYERKDDFKDDSEGKEAYSVFIFWLKNSMNYYERTYKRVQDIASSIGGLYQVINIIAFYINYYYNNYIVLSDTKNLLSSSIKIEKNNCKNSENINNLLKKKIKNVEKLKTDDDKNLKKSLDRNKFDERFKNKNRKNKSENDFSKSNNNCITDYNDNNNYYKIEIKKSIDIENNKKDDINKKDYKEEKNFFSFILFKLNCCNQTDTFKIYKDFRIKMISEEHLIKNHLNIYNLFRITEKKRKFRRYSYKLKDLIKLV